MLLFKGFRYLNSILIERSNCNVIENVISRDLSLLEAARWNCRLRLTGNTSGIVKTSRGHGSGSSSSTVEGQNQRN
jgi:hypothetical protein